ncbi:hypothetical protein PRIC1_005240 [Phytophthora ramorum]|nr:hypothetical protein KRP22_1825 [Phytophthora ramorum]
MTTSLESHRRRSLSESCHLNHLASLGEESDEAEEAEASLARRSKSESFICTAQGVVFQDATSRYQGKLHSLEEMAASASGSQSNVLLAKKALRYRKVLESRRLVE